MIVKEWKHSGLNCCIRKGMFGTYNGYVQDPTDGKFNGNSSGDTLDLQVHGGITWHGPLKQEGLETVWLGFDTCHVGDFDGIGAVGKPLWTLEMVEQETNSLADQVARKAERG